MLLELRPINWLALPFLKDSRAYRDLSTPEYYNDVKADTLNERGIHPGHSALWAHLLYGQDEDVILL